MNIPVDKDFLRGIKWLAGAQDKRRAMLFVLKLLADPQLSKTTQGFILEWGRLREGKKSKDVDPTGLVTEFACEALGLSSEQLESLRR